MALNLRLFWDTSRLPGGNRELIGKSLKRNCLPLSSSGVISLCLNFTPYFNIWRLLWKLFYLLEFKSLWKVAFYLLAPSSKAMLSYIFFMLQSFFSIIKKIQHSNVFWTFFWKLFIFNLPYSFHTYFSHLYIGLSHFVQNFCALSNTLPELVQVYPIFKYSYQPEWQEREIYFPSAKIALPVCVLTNTVTGNFYS